MILTSFLAGAVMTALLDFAALRTRPIWRSEYVEILTLWQSFSATFSYDLLS